MLRIDRSDGMLCRDEILREVTLRICSGLKIRETLRHAFEYLSKVV
jgi:hypothetical protein